MTHQYCTSSISEYFLYRRHGSCDSCIIGYFKCFLIQGYIEINSDQCFLILKIIIREFAHTLFLFLANYNLCYAFIVKYSLLLHHEPSTQIIFEFNRVPFPVMRWVLRRTKIISTCNGIAFRCTDKQLLKIDLVNKIEQVIRVINVFDNVGTYNQVCMQLRRSRFIKTQQL